MKMAALWMCALLMPPLSNRDVSFRHYRTLCQVCTRQLSQFTGQGEDNLLPGMARVKLGLMTQSEENRTRRKSMKIEQV
jgi:hypothetical protein